MSHMGRHEVRASASPAALTHSRPLGQPLLRLLCAVFALGALLLVGAARASAADPLLPGATINSDWNTMGSAAINTELDDNQFLGSKVIRLTVRWPYLQPNSSSSYDATYVSQLGSTLAAAQAPGLEA